MYSQQFLSVSVKMNVVKELLSELNRVQNNMPAILSYPLGC